MPFQETLSRKALRESDKKASKDLRGRRKEVRKENRIVWEEKESEDGDERKQLKAVQSMFLLVMSAEHLLTLESCESCRWDSPGNSQRSMGARSLSC